MSARDVRYQAAGVDGQRLLLLRCAPRDEAPFWVLPGGGREAGEPAEACVAREVGEEAGIEVAVGPLLCDVPADPPDGTCTRWRTYLCRVTRGEAAAGGGEAGAEITAVRWLPLDEPAGWEPALRADRFLPSAAPPDPGRAPALARGGHPTSGLTHAALVPTRRRHPPDLPRATPAEPSGHLPGGFSVVGLFPDVCARVVVVSPGCPGPHA